MSKNNLVLVIKHKGKYYVVSNVNADTQWCDSFATFMVQNSKSLWTYDRGAALIRAHNIQKQTNTEYGVREYNLKLPNQTLSV
jgi:hypothetical protein